MLGLLELFLLISMATSILSFTISREHVLVPVKNWAYKHEFHWFHYLLRCSLCISFWIALLFWVLSYFTIPSTIQPRILIYFLIYTSSIGVSYLFQRLYGVR